jgi:ABC-2 type transport system permease protein
MRRFLLLLRNEIQLFRTALPIHLVAVLQPVIFFLLMSAILVYPTFDVNIVEPATPEGRALVAAMQQVGSPIGLPYIDPILLSADEAHDPALRQVIEVESRDGVPTAVQRFGLIDSNQVKNLRNRLTAAALIQWNDALGDRAVTVVERPWLAVDVPYAVYYGLGMLPMVAFMAAIFIGGILTAQDIEFGTITEYRLAPTRPTLILGARVVRLALTGLLSAATLLLVAGLRTGFWPSSLGRVALVILPMALTGAGLGITVGLLLQHSIPTLLIGLVTSLGSWILGSAFGLAAGFGGPYERVSRLMPNTHAVELIFSCYYGMAIGAPGRSVAFLAGVSLGALALAALVYQQQVLQKG